MLFQVSVKFRFDKSKVALNRLWCLSDVLSQLSFFSNGNYDRLAFRRRESIKAAFFLSASRVITFPTCVSLSLFFSLSGCVYEKDEANGLNELECTEIGYLDLAGSTRCFAAVSWICNKTLSACIDSLLASLQPWCIWQYKHSVSDCANSTITTGN